MDFKVVLTRGQSGYFVATVPSLPGCVTQGRTEKDALKNVQEAISLHLKCLTEDGIPLQKKDYPKELLVKVSV